MTARGRILGSGQKSESGFALMAGSHFYSENDNGDWVWVEGPSSATVFETHEAARARVDAFDILAEVVSLTRTIQFSVGEAGAT